MTRAVLRMLFGIVLAGSAAGCELFRVQGPQPAMGAQDCVGVPASTCREMVASRVNERAGVELVGYRITCVADSCTVPVGEAEASLVWADGMTETFTFNWRT